MQQELTALDQLADLYERRNQAWAAFNPGIPPSAANDWPAFAEANWRWETFYESIYGHRPPRPFDDVDTASSRYYQARRYPQRREREYTAKSDEERDKANRRKQEIAKRAAVATNSEDH